MITIDEKEKNLGIIPFGSNRFFTYKIKNDYDFNIIITDLLAGCHSCTDSTIDKRVLFPGEEGTITVNFTPGVTGEHNKKVTILSKNEKGKRNPNVTLHFKAIVV